MTRDVWLTHGRAQRPERRAADVDVACPVTLHASEDVSEVLERIDPACLARRHERVHARGGARVRSASPSATNCGGGRPRYRGPVMQVLLVCGSLQRTSANRAALDVARAVLSANGVEVSVFEGLGLIPPLNPDRDGNPGEVVLAFRAQIGLADAVLIAAPEYAGAIAGVVKNALDWVVGSGDLYGKPVALLSAGTSGGIFARRDLVRTLSWQGAHVVASLASRRPTQGR